MGHVFELMSLPPRQRLRKFFGVPPWGEGLTGWRGYFVPVQDEE